MLGGRLLAFAVLEPRLDELQRRMPGEPGDHVLRAEERAVRWKHGPLDVAGELLVALLDQLPARLEPGSRVVDEDDEAGLVAFGREVVEQRDRFVEEERQVVLDARRKLRLGDVAVQRALRRVGLERCAKALPESLDRFLI